MKKSLIEQTKHKIAMLEEEKEEMGRLSIFKKRNLEYYQEVLKKLELLDILHDALVVETMDTSDSTYEKVSCYLDDRELWNKVDEFNKVKNWLEHKEGENNEH